MDTATVVGIKQRAVKSGVGAKGDWQQDIVILDNGEEVRIFGPIEIGDTVESYDNDYNGKVYKNWRLKDGSQAGPASNPKPRANSNADGGITTDQIYVEVLKQGKIQQEILDRLKVLMGEEPETPEVALEQADKAADKQAEAAPDEVVQMLDDEPINLDDIPF